MPTQSKCNILYYKKIKVISTYTKHTRNLHDAYTKLAKIIKNSRLLTSV